jgi:hypothetical protein
MDIGSQLVAWCPYRGWVVGEVVWTGAQPINPPGVSSSSSLLNDGGGGNGRGAAAHGRRFWAAIDDGERCRTYRTRDGSSLRC